MLSSIILHKYSTIWGSILLLMEFWVVSSFQLSENSCYEHVSTSFCEHMLLFLLSKYLEVELIGERVTVCLLVKSTSFQFLDEYVLGSNIQHDEYS